LRALVLQIDYNLAFRWFVGLNIDDPMWDHSTFPFNRDRSFDVEIAQKFFANLANGRHFRDRLSGQDLHVCHRLGGCLPIKLRSRLPSTGWLPADQTTLLLPEQR